MKILIAVSVLSTISVWALPDPFQLARKIIEAGSHANQSDLALVDELIDNYPQMSSESTGMQRLLDIYSSPTKVLETALEGFLGAEFEVEKIDRATLGRMVDELLTLPCRNILNVVYDVYEEVVQSGSIELNPDSWRWLVRARVCQMIVEDHELLLDGLCLSKQCLGSNNIIKKRIDQLQEAEDENYGLNLDLKAELKDMKERFDNLLYYLLQHGVIRDESE